MARILVIDDNPSFRQMMAGMLHAEGHTVEVAPEGRTGVEMFQAAPFDVVITDILMPVMEGVETIRTLRSLERPVRIVAMTGGGRMKVMRFLEIADAFGADATIEKPFQREQLLDLLARLLPPAASSSDVPPASNAPG